MSFYSGKLESLRENEIKIKTKTKKPYVPPETNQIQTAGGEMWASVLFNVFQSTLLQPELNVPAICPGVLIHHDCQALRGAGCQGRLHGGSAT